MKIIRTLLVMLISMILISCSAEVSTEKSEYTTNEYTTEDLKFRLIKKDNNSGNMTYIIQVKNTGKQNIGYLKLYFQYPIINDNKYVSNPFLVEGRSMDEDPIKLDPNEQVTFKVYAPIYEVFRNKISIETDNPALTLEGYILDGEYEVPISKSASLDVILKTSGF